MPVRLLLLILLGLLLSLADAAAFRCGNALVQEGDTTFIVLKKCGEPEAVEEVGYTGHRRNSRYSLTGRRASDLKIEQWTYGPQSGWYYLVIFEGARVVKIEPFRIMGAGN